MDDFYIGVISCLAGLAFGVLSIGIPTEQATWERDCSLIGKHVSRGVVYECKKVEKRND